MAHVPFKMLQRCVIGVGALLLVTGLWRSWHKSTVQNTSSNESTRAIDQASTIPTEAVIAQPVANAAVEVLSGSPASGFPEGGLAVSGLAASGLPASGVQKNNVAPVGQLTPAWLTRFDAQVAAGQQAAAIRAALILLQAQHVEIDPAIRAQIISRLAQLLPKISDDQARAVLAVVQHETLSASDAAAVIARSSVIADTHQRTALVRSLLTGEAQREVPTAVLVGPLTDSDPRVRAAAASVVAQRAQAGDSVAEAARALQQKTEVDPRVRRLLDDAATQLAAVRFPEDNPDAIPLPPAAERSRPYTVESVWEPDVNSSSKACLNRSIVTVLADGTATVDTIREDRQGTWHVRYEAWAWRDASGALVVDGRNQPVTYLQRPSGGYWIPDSMQIQPDGSTAVIDDARQGSDGQTGMPGDG